MTNPTAAQRFGYAEAEAITGIPNGTLRVLVHRKLIPHYRLSRRLVVFDRDELLAWLEAAHVAPTKP